MRVADLNLKANPYLIANVKGGRKRPVQIFKELLPILIDYLEFNNIDIYKNRFHHLFQNKYGNHFSRVGIADIIKKYSIKAKLKDPSFPTDISPHTFRHSCAMHLVRKKIDLLDIKEHLGHQSIESTLTYLQSNSQERRERLEKTFTGVLSPTKMNWPKTKDNGKSFFRDL